MKNREATQTGKVNPLEVTETSTPQANKRHRNGRRNPQETKRKIESLEAKSEGVDKGRSHGRGHGSNPEGTVRPPGSAW